MKAGLTEINELVGVWGSLVCDNQGGLVENVTPPDLTKPTLENISRHVVDLVSVVGEQIEGVTEAVLYYQDRRLYAADLEKAVLIVVCTPSVNIPLLRMSTNLVLTNWKEDPAVQKKLSDIDLERV